MKFLRKNISIMPYSHTNKIKKRLVIRKSLTKSALNNRARIVFPFSLSVHAKTI